ncbi:ABC transporter ATP-binding protein [Sneathiella chinensis]|uniref:ABC transporter ATP-binding protein n=1 Tax=Sneathiella chinensis TaxID=349750 RepID=A0ABQ5U240_9PROT|nr:ABC transporter ATP-binding protein [Sneathiella chinensis]GLQ05903.1 ABC transporter ATP-binding protein [Sneathiella chinensis]
MLDVKNLTVGFPVRNRGEKAMLMAVNDVSLTLNKGDALGLVGESGSGKSTIGRTILHLNPSTSGHIALDGEEITRLSAAGERALRKRAQMIFQDPHSALNPRMTILRSVAEPLVLHTRLRGSALREKVGELLETVGLQKQFLYRYPHELSGGQKQRVCIARAMALNPELLVLDEPTSALDVSVQAQILEFLKSIQQQKSLTYLFISHNLAVVRYMCNRVAVMYLGKIVEQGPTEEVFKAPRHPYTKALLEAVPLPEAGQSRRTAPLGGDIPSPLNPPTGCAFHTRCDKAIAGKCDRVPPPEVDFGHGHVASCFLGVEGQGTTGEKIRELA